MLLEVDRARPAVVERHLGVAAEDRPHRERDVGGVEARGRHLVQQRLERVEVLGVDDRHVGTGADELAGGRKSREAGADDDDPGPRSDSTR